MFNNQMLNEQQRNAVNDTEGAVLVFAGAGSGKTRVLTHRIIHLIEDMGINDYNILAITFTNKATREMKQRLNDMLGNNNVWVSTFHSLCVKILYRNAEKLGYTSSFSIFDESASKRAVQKAMREQHIEEDKYRDTFLYHISAAKNEGLNPDQYFAKIRVAERDAMSIVKIYERYEAILKENNAMDFDDLLMKCEQLLREHSDVLSYYQQKFRYIHVDEFQDTNEIQMKIVKLLSGRWNNVFVVGDDDQSIYGWRGADIRNILEFEKNFGEAKIYKLEQNYRSTQQILDAANRLIKHNRDRKSKELFSEKKNGARVEYITATSDYNEVDNILSIIANLKRYNDYGNSDFAILVRNNSLTRLFERGLTNARLPYRVFGGFKFFDRKEILDVVAYMRLIINPSDSDALLRIINFPKRGIGDTTIELLEEYALRKGVSLCSVVADIEHNESVSLAVKSKICVFNDLLNDLALQSTQNKITDFASYLVDRVGFKAAYMATGKEEDATRWENIDEFLRYIEETAEENPDIGLTEFLQTIALNNERKEDDDEEYITLATMHSAKGLEFKTVFIVACEEGIIPSSLSLKDNGAEEERRVMYVAMTRAQERLYISCVNGYRNKFGRQERTMPSRFIAEAKGEESRRIENIRRDAFNPYLEGKTDDYSGAIPNESQMRSLSGYVSNTVVQQPKKVYNESSDGFVAGAKVKHKRYGYGTVLIKEGTGSSTVVTVVFKELGIKKFALANAPLELVK